MSGKTRQTMSSSSPVQSAAPTSVLAAAPAAEAAPSDANKLLAPLKSIDMEADYFKSMMDAMSRSTDKDVVVRMALSMFRIKNGEPAPPIDNPKLFYHHIAKCYAQTLYSCAADETVAMDRAKQCWQLGTDAECRMMVATMNVVKTTWTARFSKDELVLATHRTRLEMAIGKYPCVGAKFYLLVQKDLDFVIEKVDEIVGAVESRYGGGGAGSKRSRVG